MKYYAVIDTNVVVSALLKENSLPWQILNLIVEGKIIPIFNEEILGEYKDVLTRNKFGFSETNVAMTISLIKDFGQKMEPIEILEKFIDEKDIVFYQIVMSARQTQESYLVTGNIKHFPKKKFIVTPFEMLDIIKKNSP